MKKIIMRFKTYKIYCEAYLLILNLKIINNWQKKNVKLRQNLLTNKIYPNTLEFEK